MKRRPADGTEAASKVLHLVLDDDVHAGLKERRHSQGVPMKEFGNAVLRVALGMPRRRDLIVERLVQTGKITQEDWDQAAAGARQAAQEALQTSAGWISESKAPLLTSGSWEGKRVYRDPETFQLFELWARDEHQVPTPMHRHEHSRSRIVVLEGRVRCRVDGRDRILEPRESITFLPGTRHSTAPLTRATRILVIIAPPEASSSAGHALPYRGQGSGKRQRRSPTKGGTREGQAPRT